MTIKAKPKKKMKNYKYRFNSDGLLTKIYRNGFRKMTWMVDDFFVGFVIKVTLEKRPMLFDIPKINFTSRTLMHSSILSTFKRCAQITLNFRRV